MAEILAAVTRYLDEREWPYAQHESLPILKVDYQGDSGAWTLYLRARDEADQVIVLSAYPGHVGEENRLAMADFVNRANFGLNIGNFEMDVDDGEVRCRTSIDVEGSQLDDALLETLLVANLTLMDDYFTGIGDVLAGLATAAQAIQRIEGVDEQPR